MKLIAAGHQQNQQIISSISLRMEWMIDLWFAAAFAAQGNSPAIQNQKNFD